MVPSTDGRFHFGKAELEKKAAHLTTVERKCVCLVFCFLVIAKWLPWDLYVGFTTKIKYFKLSKVSAI